MCVFFFFLGGGAGALEEVGGYVCVFTIIMYFITVTQHNSHSLHLLLLVC